MNPTLDYDAAPQSAADECRSAVEHDWSPHHVFELSPSIRYVASYRQGKLTSQQRPDLENASAGESDRYEELFVNPALITLAGQRGDLDCGGLEYLVIRYGNFFQVVVRETSGHLSVCVEADADPIAVARELLAWRRGRSSAE